MNRLKGAGKTKCCPCDQFVNCDCGPIACSVECQWQAGTATLCGYPEYVPSSPPKKYRKRTLSGIMVGNSWNSAGCSSLNCTSNYTFSGICSYDKTTCALTQNGQRVETGTCPGNGTYPQCDIGNPFANDVLVVTPTTRNFSNGGACYQLTGSQWFSRPSSPTAQEALSDEDTEDDAIARLGLGWGGCPTGCITCTSFRPLRTPGVFSFSFRKVQARANLNGMTPGNSYTVTFKLMFRPYGTGIPWAFYGTVTVGFTATLVTGTTSWVDVPAVDGYEILVSGCSAE